MKCYPSLGKGNFWILMPIDPRRGGQRASMAVTIGLLEIGLVGGTQLARPWLEISVSSRG